MSESVEGQAGAYSLTPEAYQEFESFFLGWLNRYQGELEFGGLGNPRELATLCAVWAKRHACQNDEHLVETEVSSDL